MLLIVVIELEFQAVADVQCLEVADPGANADVMEFLEVVAVQFPVAAVAAATPKFISAVEKRKSRLELNRNLDLKVSLRLKVKAKSE